MCPVTKSRYVLMIFHGTSLYQFLFDPFPIFIHEKFFFIMLTSNTTTTATTKYSETFLDRGVLYKLPYLCTYVLESLLPYWMTISLFARVSLKTNKTIIKNIIKYSNINNNMNSSSHLPWTGHGFILMFYVHYTVWSPNVGTIIMPIGEWGGGEGNRKADFLRSQRWKMVEI